jgi:hypothetical protein
LVQRRRRDQFFCALKASATSIAAGGVAVFSGGNFSIQRNTSALKPLAFIHPMSAARSSGSRAASDFTLSSNVASFF